MVNNNPLKTVLDMNMTVERIGSSIQATPQLCAESQWHKGEFGADGQDFHLCNKVNLITGFDFYEATSGNDNGKYDTDNQLANFERANDLTSATNLTLKARKDLGTCNLDFIINDDVPEQNQIVCGPSKVVVTCPMSNGSIALAMGIDNASSNPGNPERDGTNEDAAQPTDLAYGINIKSGDSEIGIKNANKNANNCAAGTPLIRIARHFSSENSKSQGTMLIDPRDWLQKYTIWIDTESKTGENLCYCNIKLSDDDELGATGRTNTGAGNFSAKIGLESGSEDDRCYCEAEIYVTSAKGGGSIANNASQRIRVGRKIDSSLISN